MSAISLENVYFKYDREGSLILNNINMNIDYGQITLLAGFSGSGKSIIFSLICGIIPNLQAGLFKGSINKVVDMIDEDVIVGTICDSNYQMVEGILPIFPSVCIYRNQILDSVLYGFKNSDKLFESIAKEKVAC